MDRIIVEIKNKDHPHYPKRGYIEVKNNRVHIDMVGGYEMFTVHFENGERGMATYSDCKRITRITMKTF